MAEFTDYLTSLNRRSESPSFTDYLEDSPPSFTDYLDTETRLQRYSQSVVPQELEPTSPMGVGSAFTGGFWSGLTLGYGAPERTAEEVEAMTTGELVSESIGHLAGGALPFIITSAVTGGYGAPVAGANYMNKAYKSLGLIRKYGDAVKRAEKVRGKSQKILSGTGKIKNRRQVTKNLKDADKIIKSSQKNIALETKKLNKFKSKYIDDLLKQGKIGEARRLSKMTGLPQASGLLGRRKAYQEFIEKIAKSDSGFMGLKGFDLANAANRFFNNATTFSAVGLVSNKPGESLVDRIFDIPKDVFMGGLFTATSLPRLYGLGEGASKAIEGTGILGIGAYGDYLTGEPDENMDMRDRLIHGLTLLGFHYAGQGLSKWGVKDKAYNALIDMGFDEPIAMKVAYKTPLMDNIDKAARQQHNKDAVIFKSKKSKTLYAIDSVKTSGEDKSGPATISYTNVKTGTKQSIQGSTLADAKNKFYSKFERFDFKDEKLISELPKELQQTVEQNIDFHRRLEKELIMDDVYWDKIIEQSSIKHDSGYSKSYRKELLKDIKFTDSEKDYTKQRKLLNSSFKKNNYERWDKASIIRLIYPESMGDINNLSARQLRRVRKFINDDIRSERYYDSVVAPSIPESYFTKVTSPYYRKALRAMGKVALPISTLYNTLNTQATRQVARLTKEFVRWRTNLLGTHIAAVNEMQRQLKTKGIKIKNVNEKIQAFIDPKYKKLQRDPKYIKFREELESVQFGEGREKINGFEYVLRTYKALNEQMARAQISSNSWIKNVRKNKYERFIKIIDKNGREVELIDFYKNPKLHAEQVTSFLKWAESGKRLKTVINKDGKRVRVNAKKSHHHYQTEYSRRVISDDFKELMTDNKNVFNEVVRHVMENDKQFSKIRDMGKREEIVRAHLLNVKNMFNKDHIYGQQFTRVANLPAYVYRYLDEGGSKRVIQLPLDGEFSPRGGLYKIGESITDIHGQKRKISEVVPVYEGEYGKLMQNYSEGIAHSTATYHSYGMPLGKKRDFIINDLANRVGRETNDPSFEKFTKEILKTQTMGDEANWISKVAAPIIRWNAIAGLSSSMSGLKNLMLGNIQNATVFTSRELLQTYGEFFTKKGRYKSEKAFAEEIGATYTGAYDLYLGEIGPSGFMKKWLPNLGLMRTTEIMNRTIASAMGKHALQIHVANLAGTKLPSTRGLSKTDSRRIMLDVFEFTPDQVSDMIYRRRNSGKGGKMQFSSFEEKKAAQQAHTITQGSGELPYVPYWMGKAWAKPLTLFYRIAYRMTESVGKNVVKPIIVDGNMAPAMKYLPLTAGAGYSLMQIYDWFFGEERANKFKSMPAQYFEYFLKAEGLALFSNMYDSADGITFDSYKPVVIRNAEEFVDNAMAFYEGKKTLGQAVGDASKRIISRANSIDRQYKYLTGDVQKKFFDSRRRQSQYTDAFYPKEKLDIDFDGGLTTKSPHYRMLKDVFWHTDNEEKARRYYTSLVFLTHRIMMDNRGMTYGVAEKEARSRIKRTISRLRPIPDSWRKTKARTTGTKYREYISKLTPEQREQEESIENIYRERRQEFFQSIGEFRSKYYKKG